MGGGVLCSTMHGISNWKSLESKSQLLKKGQMSLLMCLSYSFVPWELILVLMQPQPTIKISSWYLSCQHKLPISLPSVTLSL